jgi:hypothetical protein
MGLTAAVPTIRTPQRVLAEISPVPHYTDSRRAPGLRAPQRFGESLK